eukprot:CAMPEP_0195525844 /NCGR_PEP_ID=MMETSP0794_2-20130614/26499_1 /TAXON_ID=515487 /ORGANISM="Stephanopyxis turris, Strain CCMP 815" /LENGTH=909 /DNA_ID=CAMNT_0040656391 /DNA_START=290 /DNA_END=3019 /DNA_ORIENTATION=+
MAFTPQLKHAVLVGTASTPSSPRRQNSLHYTNSNDRRPPDVQQRDHHYHNNNNNNDNNRNRNGCALFSSTMEDTRTKDDDKTKNILSDVDAKVLQSMLEEDPDIVSQRSINKLLEQNEKAQQAKRDRIYNNDNAENQYKKQQQQNAEKEDSKFSSTVLKAVTSNEWWNSIRAKSETVFESLGLYVSNKLERDFTTAFALGAFFVDRAARDSSKLLSAAPPTVEKLFRLGDSSSYKEESGISFLLSPADNQNNRDKEMDIFEQLNTPMDEIKYVTKRIQDIISSSSIPMNNDGTTGSSSSDSSPSSSPNNGRTLNTVLRSNASSAEKQRRAYQARKKLSLAREKENPMQNFGRVTKELADGGWELKQELEYSEAGYKTRELREGVSKGFGDTMNILTGGSSTVGKFLKQQQKQEEIYIEAAKEDVVDVSTQIPKVVAPSAPPKPQPIPSRPTPPAPLMSLHEQNNLYTAQKEKLVQNINMCLEEPDQTWLVPQNLSGNIEINDEALEEIIAQMVTIRNEFQRQLSVSQIDRGSTISQSRLLTNLEEMEDIVFGGTIMEWAVKAVGSEAALMLKNEILWEVDFKVLQDEKDRFDMETTVYERDVEAWESFKNEQELVQIRYDDFVKEQEQIVAAAATAAAERQRVAAAATEAAAKQRELMAKIMGNVNVAVETQPSTMDNSNDLPFYIDSNEKDNVIRPNGDATNQAEQIFETEIMEKEDTKENNSGNWLWSSKENKKKREEANTIVDTKKPNKASAMPILDVDVDNVAAADAFDVTTDEKPLMNNANEQLKNNQEEKVWMNSRDYDDSVIVEVVSDDQDISVDAAFVVEHIPDDEDDAENKKEDNLALTLALRAADVVFFVGEKVVTVGVPGVISASTTASSRLKKIEQNGLGSEGWDMLDNLQGAAKRY